MRFFPFMLLLLAMANPFCCCSAAVQAGVEAGKPLPLAPSCCGGEKGAENSEKTSGGHGPEQCPHQTGSGLVQTADSLKLSLPLEWIAAPELRSELSWSQLERAVSGLLPTARKTPGEKPPAPPARELTCSWLV